jgi:PPM family protein phosphatase
MNLSQVVSLSDTGRKRRHNEDSYVCEPPLFAIADGMGGAQAGEVASELAANALHDHAGDPGGGEKRVVSLIQEANRRVFERASQDSSLSGMGTTLTLAIAEEGHVSLGHVGDSRAYLLRDGKLGQITEDHSLVAELTRAGKLSEEEAESHPQRSVITRALGTDPDVDVDAFTIETQDGDIFLLCSDGLTAMVDDETIQAILEKRRANLKRGAQDLVKAANKSGGEDNITVLLFEIGQAAEGAEGTEGTGAQAEQEDDEDTLSELDGVPVIAAAKPDEWAQDGDVPEPVLDHGPPRRSRARLYWIIALAILLAIIGLGLFGLSQSHFVGAQKDGHVAVYQGLPYDILGINLYRTAYVSRVLAAQLTQPERQHLFNHDLRGFDSAKAAIGRYEEEIPP